MGGARCIFTRTKAFCHQVRPEPPEYRGGHMHRRHTRLSASVARSIGALAFLLISPISVAGPACAQTWPDRPVKIIVPFAAGGTADAVPQLVADWLSRKWGQPVIIE